MTQYKQLLERAAKMCSTSEKCSADIHRKLTGWGMDPDDADKAIGYLQDQNFIDDRRFAGFFVQDKLKFNHWGRIKIRYMLKQKQIDDAIVDKALGELDPEFYEEVLQDVVSGKARSLGSTSNASNRAKLIRFAYQKGFTYDEINRALDSLGDDEG